MSRRNRIVIPGEEEIGEHTRPFADQSGRKAVDALFRQKGYKIWSRAGHDEPIWEKGGVLFPQHEVELRMDKRELADAVYLEELHRKGIENERK